MDRFFLCCKEINSAILIQYPTSRCAILGMKTIHKASIIHRLQCFANMSDYRGIAKLEAIQIYVIVALFSITLNFKCTILPKFHHYSTFNLPHLERSLVCRLFATLYKSWVKLHKPIVPVFCNRHWTYLQFWKGSIGVLYEGSKKSSTATQLLVMRTPPNFSVLI